MEIKINPSERIAPTPKESNKPMLLALALVSAVTAAAGYYFYQEDQQMKAAKERLELEEKQKRIEAKRLALEARKKAKNIKLQKQRMENRSRHDEIVIHAHRPQTNEPENQQTRQTEFNDRNYIPQGAVNTVAAPPQRFYQASNNTQRPEPIRTLSARAQWESYSSGKKGAQKESIWFQYETQGNKIITSSICKNMQRGSIEYRTCRKAAKQHFQKQCRAKNRTACTASNMTP